MSDVSSDNLPSSSDEDERRQRIFADAEIPEPAELYIPGPVQLDLQKFVETHPREDLEGLTNEELSTRLEMSLKIKQKLEKIYSILEDQHKAEWLAKERALDQVLEKQGIDLV